MARALKCDQCGIFIPTNDEAAKDWLTLQVFPCVKADDDEEFTEYDFCSMGHAGAYLMVESEAGSSPPDAIIAILESLQSRQAVNIAYRGHVRQLLEQVMQSLLWQDYRPQASGSPQA